MRAVTRDMTAPTTSSAEASGKGIGATTTRARARSATNSSVFQHALYAWSVVSSSSSGPSASERRTALTPLVALVTKARSSGDAPRKAASEVRAASSRSSSSRERKRTGSASISARRAD